MKIGVVIQARMGSTRLPGKVLRELKGKSVLNHVIERVKQAEKVDQIIIATTTLSKDNVIESEAKKNDVSFFRGSESDVLSRFYFAAVENKLDVIVRVTSDCPLIDSRLLDNMIDFYLNNQYSLVSNAGTEPETRNFPRGLDIEIFAFSLLESAFKNAQEMYQREHVTPYIYENTEDVHYYKANHDLSGYRWTLDTEEDLQLITEIYEKLYHGEHDFYMNDVVNLYHTHPELSEINSHIEQKKLNK
ncbi:cytidylyltransferase domain-containing protein [Alkalibacterium kapii]|uniref:Spore coat protein n=1 Tax=Alkalibacterium kapii TaxID=426704 RepID=A0A511ASF1_9LACT|nr:glycosyltransferase family protein [Alkalibacterium kapii]GEK91026.1 spore coat protein [Alkalibacterium kapii]